MTNSNKNLSLASIGVISLANAVFPFLSLFVLTRFIPLADFGELVVYETILSLLIPIIQVAFSATIIEFFKLSRLDFRSYIQASLVIFLLGSSVTCFSLFAGADVISSFFSLNPIFLSLLPLLAVLGGVVQLPLSLAQCEAESKVYALFLLGPSMCSFLATIFFLFFMELGFESKLYGLLLSNLFFSMFAIRFLFVRGWLNEFRFEQTKAKLNLKVTLPLLPHTIAAGLYFSSDRLFIASMLNEEAVAIYGAGLQLAMIMAVIQNSMAKAWNPYALKLIEEDASKVHAQYLEGFLVRVLAGAFGLGVISIVFIFVMSIGIDIMLPPEYSNSISIVKIHVVGFFFLGIYKLLSPFIWSQRKTGSLSIITIVALIINLFLNYFLIPVFGSLGAAYATMISVLVQLGLTTILCFRLRHLVLVGDR